MNKLYGFVVASVIAVSGCGGSGPGFVGPKVQEGVFKDSNVQGLGYVSGSQKGETDKNGVFKYEEGSKVTFAVGAVEIGSAIGKAIMTPLDLVANGNLASDEVINRVRFLMMLDKNNKPSDGIEISRKVQTIAKEWGAVNFKATDFLSEVSSISAQASAEDGVAHTLPDKTTAVAHIKITLLCSYAGGFRGTYSGDEAGNVAFVVDPSTGNLTGSSYNTVNKVSVEINSKNPIDYDKDLGFVSEEDSGKRFAGKFNSTDALSGSWENSLTPAIKGNFSVTRIGGQSAAIYRYAATFVGSEKGLFTFDVDASNKVTVKVYSVTDDVTSELSGTIKDNKLKAKKDKGIEINANIDDQTHSIQGVWTNLSDLTTGTLMGVGCKLN